MAQFTDDPIHILFLNSYNSRMNWYREILRGVEEVLTPDQNNIILHLENMDTKEFQSEEYVQAFSDFIELKYRDNHFSLIFCSDNNAFDFLREQHNRLYPGVPIVFCGVNDFEDSMITDHKEITGIAETFSARTTVETALLLHPDTREVYIINDFLKTGRAWQRDIESELSSLENQLKIRYSEDLSMEELQKEIASLSDQTIILLGVYYSDRNGLFFTYEKTGEAISSVSKVPLYCLTDFNITRGVMGGDVLSGFMTGEAMAGMGLRILQGEFPWEIPPVKAGLTEKIFNYPELERFSIPLKSLPPHSRVINRPYSVYREYFWEFWILMSILILLLVVVIALIVNIYRKKRAENTLRELTEASWEGILIHNRGVALQFNDMFLNLFGYNRDEIQGQQFIDRIFTRESSQKVIDRINAGNLEPYEAMGVKKDGSQFPVEVRVRVIESQGQKARVAAIRDMTDQKKMEEGIRQSQKMQALGTLAGGISHDFNNILSAVLGYADIGLLESEPDGKVHFYFEQILAAGRRARQLIKQILAFSQQSKIQKQPVILNDIIQETINLLYASLPSSITIHMDLSTEICVFGDPVQLQQIIMNLCTNAGLAMKEKGGTLDLVLKECIIDEPSLSDSYLPSGMYAQLMVSDTGCGMTEEVRSRIFEPFYTTRKTGEGTGMGLSVVHGIIAEMSGSIHVYSSEGTGTTFNVILPVCSHGPYDKGENETETL
ncbi:ATP-binding protein [Oceanispirochaeta sp.]|uniref:ATP-binding protein n=1 Tax=Oceanispirochaeta sp. TaxID=2035350 RepID=UPI002621DB42|nr:ATP-binding protein [Oceanispirochaeta sp.]MDA3957287.1 ATP-binding protein [Oceanispirochaeta sp.]